MVEDFNGYFSSVFSREDISSLPVPDANFQEAKCDYLGWLIVIPEIVGKKISCCSRWRSFKLEISFERPYHKEHY